MPSYQTISCPIFLFGWVRICSLLLHLVETGIIKTGRPQVARPVAKLHLSGSFFDHIWSDVSCVLPQESCEKQICSGRARIEFQLGFVSKAELQTKIAQLYDVCVEQQVVWPFCRLQ